MDTEGKVMTRIARDRMLIDVSFIRNTTPIRKNGNYRASFGRAQTHAKEERANAGQPLTLQHPAEVRGYLPPWKCGAGMRFACRDVDRGDDPLVIGHAAASPQR